MAVNKVVYGNQTLIDLSTDTVASSDDILLGKVGHLRDGSVVTGTASGGDQHGTIWQDGQGYVHLDDESGIALQSKTATPTESQQVIEADTGYYALDKVTVGAISTTYVGSGITRRSSSDLTASGATVTAPTGYYSSSASKAVASGSVVPSIEGSDTPYIWVDSSGLIHSDGGYSATINPVSASGWINASATTELEIGLNGTYQLSTQSAKTVTPTTSAQTAVASGKYTTGAVTVAAMPTGTAGTPTATKGTVSNHSVTVTPSVTNTTGYITGSTKTGTGVSVSASELVSGTYSVTSSGTKDVTNYASASVPAGTEGTPTATKGTVSNHSVSVTPSVTNTGGYISGTTKTGTAVTVSASELVSGSLSITQNGTGIDVTNYASVNVQISQTYTATITSAGSSSSAYITYKNVKYYTVGTFTFTAEDDFSVVATGNVGGEITYNDDVYNVTSKSFTFPNSDITISMSTGSTGSVNIQTSMMPITANGKYTVNGYDRVNVNVTPTLITKNITANGTYNASSDSADGYSSVTVNVTSVPSVVTGTFTPNSADAGTAVEISIPYTGTGYPIELMIDVDGGIDGNTSYSSLIDRYSMARQFYSKEYHGTTPTYGSSGTENIFRAQYLYKSSDTSATNYSGANSTAYLTNNANATASSANCIRMKSATTMSIFVKSTSYGYSPNITYRYLILYSS